MLCNSRIRVRQMLHVHADRTGRFGDRGVRAQQAHEPFVGKNHRRGRHEVAERLASGARDRQSRHDAHQRGRDARHGRMAGRQDQPERAARQHGEHERTHTGQLHRAPRDTLPHAGHIEIAHARLRRDAERTGRGRDLRARRWIIQQPLEIVRPTRLPAALGP